MKTEIEITNYIEEAETIGRSKFIEFLKSKGITRIKTYPIESDYDLTFTAITKSNKIKTYLVEIKNRDEAYTGSTSSMLIQYDKLMKLKIYRTSLNYDCCLYVFTFDNSPMIKISNVTHTNFEGFVCQNQQRNNYSYGYKEKKVKYLNNYKTYKIG
jgi:hypothetical protein